MRDWIFQKDGASFDTEGNVTALQKLKEWVDKGYLGKGDAFNAVNDNEAAIAFSKGKGAMLIAGNWNAATVRDGLGEDAGFFNMPPGESGDAVKIGSTSFPMHISAKTKNPDLAAAYLDHITGPTPARPWSTRRRSRRRSTAPPSRATRSARASRKAGTSSSSPAG